jgi:hypothetical protein
MMTDAIGRIPLSMLDRVLRPDRDGSDSPVVQVVTTGGEPVVPSPGAGAVSPPP